MSNKGKDVDMKNRTYYFLNDIKIRSVTKNSDNYDEKF